VWGVLGVWVFGCVGVWAVWAVWAVFDIPQTALVATLDTYDFTLLFWDYYFTWILVWDCYVAFFKTLKRARAHTR
jgi:hypothetical protein